MKKQFVPLIWVERVVRGGVCHSYEIQDDRRWFDRRLQARETPDRRVLEQAVRDYLLPFCSPTLQHKLGRESARFAKAA